MRVDDMRDSKVPCAAWSWRRDSPQGRRPRLGDAPAARLEEDTDMICKAHRFNLVVTLCFCALLLAVGIAVPAGAGNAASTAGGAPPGLRGAAQPGLPASPWPIARWRHRRARPKVTASASRPGPQDVSSISGMPLAGIGDLGSLPATYDLRALSRVTAVKNQGSFGTCWSFAAMGSLESCLLTGETTNFAEDNMVLTSGFDNGGSAYNWGGNICMSTAYLVRWGGPVNESEDAYGDSITPPGLSPRKHVQEVSGSRLAARRSTTTTSRTRSCSTAAPMSRWAGTTPRTTLRRRATTTAARSAPTTRSSSSAGTTTTPPPTSPPPLPGNGAFIVKNSWGTAWGSSGYFYVSYYDARFGRGSNPMAVFDGAESTSNYTGIYQYDPLGDCTISGTRARPGGSPTSSRRRRTPPSAPSASTPWLRARAMRSTRGPAWRPRR